MAKRRMAAFADMYLQHMLRQREQGNQARLQMEIASQADQMRRAADIENDARTRGTQMDVLGMQQGMQREQAGITDMNNLLGTLTGAKKSSEVPDADSFMQSRLAFAPRKPIADLGEFTGLLGARSGRRAGLEQDEAQARDLETQSNEEQERAQFEHAPIERIIKDSAGQPVSEVTTAGQAQRAGPRPAFPPGFGMQNQPYNQQQVTGFQVNDQGEVIEVTKPWDPRNPPSAVPRPPGEAEQKDEMFFQNVFNSLNDIEKRFQGNEVLVGPIDSLLSSFGSNFKADGRTRALIERAIGQKLSPEAFEFITKTKLGRQDVVRSQAGLAQTASEFSRVKETFPNLGSQPDKFLADLAVAREAALAGMNYHRRRTGRPEVGAAPVGGAQGGPGPGGSALERLRNRGRGATQ